MKQLPYKDTVEYDIIELNEDWLAYNLAFYPDQLNNCIWLFDKFNPSLYLSILIYNVWDEITDSGNRRLCCSYLQLVETCIALLSERQTDGLETNLALGKNVKLYKYANKTTGAEGDLEFLYTNILKRFTRTIHGLSLDTQYYYIHDGVKVYIKTNRI